MYDFLDPSLLQIRVLVVQPGVPASSIHCCLQTISLSDQPSFKALSYVWGDAQDRKLVYVNNHPFDATWNLEAALRALRPPFGSPALTIWVDAICINQNDPEEKNTQLPLMGSIYSRANEVLVWLGDPRSAWLKPSISGSKAPDLSNTTDKETDAVTLRARRALRALFHDMSDEDIADNLLEDLEGSDVLKDALQILDYIRDDYHLHELPFLAIDDNLDAGLNLIPSWIQAISMLLCILEQPWIKRIWTLQEAILNRQNCTVHIGDHPSLSLETFFDAAAKFFEHVYENGCCLDAYVPGLYSGTLPDGEDILDYNSDGDLVSHGDGWPLMAPIYADHEERMLACLDQFIDLRSIKAKYDDGKLTLREVFVHTRDRKATDKRDLVYGLMGLGSDLTQAGLPTITTHRWTDIKPDCTRGLSHAFAMATRQIFSEQDGSLDELLTEPRGMVIQEAKQGTEERIRKSSVPSWVRDFRNEGSYRMRSEGMSKLPSFDACAGQKHLPHPDDTKYGSDDSEEYLTLSVAMLPDWMIAHLGPPSPAYDGFILSSAACRAFFRQLDGWQIPSSAKNYAKNDAPRDFKTAHNSSSSQTLSSLLYRPARSFLELPMQLRRRIHRAVFRDVITVAVPNIETNVTRVKHGRIPNAAFSTMDWWFKHFVHAATPIPDEPSGQEKPMQHQPGNDKTEETSREQLGQIDKRTRASKQRPDESWFDGGLLDWIGRQAAGDMATAAGFRLFVSADGRFGSGKPGITKGDHVVIAKGSKMPLILRQRKDGTSWQFVGCCYLEDTMFGEAVSESTKWENIRLS